MQLLFFLQHRLIHFVGFFPECNIYTKNTSVVLRHEHHDWCVWWERAPSHWGMESTEGWGQKMFRLWILIQNKVEVSAGHHRLGTGLCCEPVDTSTGFGITTWDNSHCQHGLMSFSSRQHLALPVHVLSYTTVFFSCPMFWVIWERSRKKEESHI